MLLRMVKPHVLVRLNIDLGAYGYSPVAGMPYIAAVIARMQHAC